VAYVPPGR